MKLRSSILFGCLLFVPMVAMFSHKIPRGVREGFRDCVWRPAVDRVSAWVAGEADRGGHAVERSAFAPVAPIVPQPAAAMATTAMSPAAPPPAAVLPTAVLPTAVSPPPPAAAPPVTLAPVTLQSTLLPQPSRGALEERLAAVGAVGLKLKPPEGQMGVHVASCRVPADASGQLQRLFQASGPTPETSLERLAVQIETWRSRVASAAAPLR